MNKKNHFFWRKFQIIALKPYSCVYFHTQMSHSDLEFCNWMHFPHLLPFSMRHSNTIKHIKNIRFLYYNHQRTFTSVCMRLIDSPSVRKSEQTKSFWWFFPYYSLLIVWLQHFRNLLTIHLCTLWSLPNQCTLNRNNLMNFIHILRLSIFQTLFGIDFSLQKFIICAYKVIQIMYNLALVPFPFR